MILSVKDFWKISNITFNADIHYFLKWHNWLMIFRVHEIAYVYGVPSKKNFSPH
jgi:hypothetical protein